MLRRFIPVSGRLPRPTLPSIAHRSIYTRAPSSRPSSSPLAPTAISNNANSRTLATGLSQTSTAVPSTSIFAALDTFERRHVGPQPASVQKMLEALGFESMDAFVDTCVPKEIRLAEDAVSSEGADGIRALSESELLKRAKELGSKNVVARNFIGMGYHQAVRTALIAVPPRFPLFPPFPSR